MIKPKKNLLLILSSFIIIIFVATFIVSIIVTKNVSKLQYYNLAGDKVASVRYVLGERKVSSVSSKTTSDMLVKQYKYYNIEEVINDVQYYVDYLCKNEAFSVKSQNSNNIHEGKVTLYKKSIVNGKDIIITIEYKERRYSIT